MSIGQKSRLTGSLSPRMQTCSMGFVFARQVNPDMLEYSPELEPLTSYAANPRACGLPSPWVVT